MKNHHRWLLDEIAVWQTEGLIGVEQARLLRARYARPAGADWGRTIFTALGAVLFGLGVILLAAYNWQGMHRFAKLAFIALALALAHGGGWWLGRDDGRHARVGESLHLLGTVLFGAGIWLVAQIYHLDEHYPNAFLVWSLGALSLAWALPSVAQGLLASALVFVWSWFEVFDFHHPNHWGPWLVALGVVPLAWLRRSRTLLFFGLCLFLALYAFSVARVDDDLVSAALFLTSGAYLGLARLAPRTPFPDAGPVCRAAGGAVYLVVLFVASFGRHTGELFGGSPEDLVAWLYWGVPLSLAAAGWGAALWRSGTRGDRLEKLEAGLIVASLALAVAAPLGLGWLPRWHWVVFSLIFAAHAGLLIALGIRLLRWQQVALGGAMLAALIFARFLDLFDSLLLRSAAFLLLGAGLFFVGLRYSKQKRGRGGTPGEVSRG